MPAYAPLTDAQKLDYLRTHVYIDEDCRIWAGPFCHGKDLPRVIFGRQSFSARRLLAQLSGRRVWPGHRLSASCGNPRCVAEKHIRIEEKAAMVRRLVAERVIPTGLPRTMAAARGWSSRAKLGMKEAHKVAQLRAEGLILREIGDRYGVTPQCVAFALDRWRKAGVIT